MPAPRLGQVVVDHVPAERVDDLVADPLGGGAAGLGELPGDPAHLDHRHAGAVGQDDGHLEDDLELVADAVGGELGEGLGAVAGLEHEARPPAAAPTRPVRWRASPAKTSGGRLLSGRGPA